MTSLLATSVVGCSELGLPLVDSAGYSELGLPLIDFASALRCRGAVVVWCCGAVVLHVWQRNPHGE